MNLAGDSLACALQEAARSEVDDEDMQEAPTLEGLQAQVQGRQAEYTSRQKRARREDLTPAKALGPPPPLLSPPSPDHAHRTAFKTWLRPLIQWACMRYAVSRQSKSAWDRCALLAANFPGRLRFRRV